MTRATDAPAHDVDPVVPKVPLLLIVGTGRSGSTLLAGLLGSVDGVFAAGEVRYLWERGLLQQRLCGCGEAVPRCPVWSAVLDEAFGGLDGADAAEMVRLGDDAARVRNLPRNLAAELRRGALSGSLEGYGQRLEQLYRAIHTVTGAALIVDSSKLPAYGGVLDQLVALDLRVLHLVRDPRAAAYSWLRERSAASSEGLEVMDRFSVGKSSALWTLWNTMALLRWGRSDRYLRVGYEDLVRDPQRTLEQILVFAGRDPAGLPLEDDGSVRLARTHQVAGNINRTRSGRLKLAEDDEWKRGLTLGRRALITAITGLLRPVLSRSSVRGHR